MKKILLILSGATIIGGVILGVVLLVSGIGAGAGTAVPADNTSFAAAAPCGGKVACLVAGGLTAVGVSSGVGAAILKKGKDITEDEGN